MTMELVARARAGDEDAFGQLVGPYQRGLRAHCYRMLGSAQDAQDAVQETLLAAWRGLGSFEGRASVATWLYQIATNRCLNALRAAGRRPKPGDQPLGGTDLPEPTRLGEVPWLEPFPDVLLDEVADRAPGPEGRHEAREAISLAFVTALQLLPPRQRAVLILRDVLGFRASEVAGVLETTEESVTSALKRARTTLRAKLPARQDPAWPDSATQNALVERFARAYEAGRVDEVVALLTDDVRLRPPTAVEYHGREVVARFMAATGLRPDLRARLVATRANGQPAFGLYVRDPLTGLAHARGLLVLTLTGGGISALTGFDTATLPLFGLPRTLAS
jgi:RNA polymerase sigma-70 factor (ECF subfamily)